jgi:effector-binding domain-containing protein
VSIRTWEYGAVAEILHVGRYSNEDTDIRRLVDFVVSQGYRVIGDHEEEYVRGPGMFFAGDPEQYLTIIRLRVQTVDVVPAP